MNGHQLAVEIQLLGGTARLRGSVIGSQVFFKIKVDFFFGYFDPINIFFDNNNKYVSG